MTRYLPSCLLIPSYLRHTLRWLPDDGRWQSRPDLHIFSLRRLAQEPYGLVEYIPSCGYRLTPEGIRVRKNLENTA